MVSPVCCLWTPTHDPVNPSHSFVNVLIYRRTSKQTQALKPHNTETRLFCLKKHMSTAGRKGETLCSLIDLFFSELQHYWMSFITEMFCRTLTGSDNTSKWLLCMPLCTICLFIFWRDNYTGTKVSSWRGIGRMRSLEEVNLFIWL